MAVPLVILSRDQQDWTGPLDVEVVQLRLAHSDRDCQVNHRDGLAGYVAPEPVCPTMETMPRRSPRGEPFGSAPRRPLVVRGMQVGQVSLPSRASNRTVRVQFFDDQKRAVGGAVVQVRADGKQVVLGKFCGTSSALRLALPGREVHVLPRARACSEGVPTSGEAVATFTS